MKHLEESQLSPTTPKLNALALAWQTSPNHLYSNSSIILKRLDELGEHQSSTSHAMSTEVLTHFEVRVFYGFLLP